MLRIPSHEYDRSRFNLILGHGVVRSFGSWISNAFVDDDPEKLGVWNGSRGWQLGGVG